jgi:hypothetical protein
MDQKTPKEKSNEMAHTDAAEKTPTKTLRAKSEYSSADKRNITIGLTVMVIIFISALVFLITGNDIDSIQTKSTADMIDDEVSELDKLVFTNMTDDYYNETDRFLVMFAEETGQFVPVQASRDKIYAANFAQQEADGEIDYDKLRDELHIELLGPEYSSYQPKKNEIATMDGTYGISHYHFGDDYCKLEISKSAMLFAGDIQPHSLSSDESSAAYGYVVKTCVSRQNLQLQAAELQPFYSIINTAQKTQHDNEYNQSVLYLQSGVRLSQIDGYEYKVGLLTDTESSASSEVRFAQYEQNEWQLFTYRSVLPACDDFSTETIRKALVAEPCIDPADEQELLVGEYYSLIE